MIKISLLLDSEKKALREITDYQIYIVYPGRIKSHSNHSHVNHKKTIANDASLGTMRRSGASSISMHNISDAQDQANILQLRYDLIIKEP